MQYFLLFIFELFLLFIVSKKITRQFFANILLVTKSKKLTLYFYSILFLPGTYLHELSHAFAATILFVPVKAINLLPKFSKNEDGEDEGVILGSVQITKTNLIRRLLIGSAPIYMGLLVLFSLLYYTSHNQLLQDWKVVMLTGYLVFTIGNTLFSERGDLEGFGKISIILAVIYLFTHWLGIRVSFSLTPQVVEKLIPLIKLCSKFLAVPLFIDLAILFAFNLSKK